MDDDPDYLLRERLQLEAAGYRVIEAGGVSEAQEAAQQHSPDLVIVDLMMEEPDAGFTVCWFLKKQHPGLPVIIVTAVAAETGLDFDAATREERAWIKADAVLAKPVRFEQLQAEMNRLGVPVAKAPEGH